MNGVTVASTKPSRRLVLHFDINKTIVMKDAANNLNNSTLTVRNYGINLKACTMFAGLCWGRMFAKKPTDKEDWTYVYDQLTETKPVVEGIESSAIMSYK